MGIKSFEVRLYGVRPTGDQDIADVENFTHETFLEVAEQQGNVWSLLNVTRILNEIQTGTCVTDDSHLIQADGMVIRAYMVTEDKQVIPIQNNTVDSK